ncbi:hypothetical protein D9M69_685300 [compost metagenome]
MNLLGGGLSSIRKAAYFICHNGKSTTCLTRPRRLDSRIEREQVSLFGDPLYDLQYPTDIDRLII